MMLKTSSNKINPTARLLGFTIRKNIGLSALASIIMLIICPGYFVTQIIELIDIRDRTYDAFNMINGFVLAVTVVAAIGVVFMNLINFSYLYSKKSSDVFHSVPLKRSGLLFARLFAGIISVLIPVVIGYVSLMLIVLLMPGVVGELTPLFIGFGYTVTAMLFASTFSMMFIICAGTIFDWGVSFFGINLGALAIGAIVFDFCSDYLRGFNSMNEADLFEYISPLYYLFNGLGKFINGAVTVKSMLIYFSVCLILIAVFYIISALLYKRRPAEKGGDSFAFKFVYTICSLIIGFCCGYGLGMIFAEAEFNPVFFIFGAIGSVLGCVIYGVITNRGFKKVIRSIVLGAISFMVLSGLLISIKTDAFGYSTRVPEKSSIETATVTLDNLDITLDDPQLILDLHKDICNQDYDDGYDKHIEFFYKLKNGTTMTRQFWIEGKLHNDELFKLFRSEERLEAIEAQIDIAYEHFDVDYYLGDLEKSEYAYIKLDKAQMREVFALYKEELKNATKYDTNHYNEVTFYYNSKIEYGMDYTFFNLQISDEFPQTREKLNELYEAFVLENEETKEGID